MATTKKKSKKKSHHKPAGYSLSKYRGNPGKKAHHKTKHRHNPGGPRLRNLIPTAAFAILGALGSKLGTQMVLGANNTGLVGYAGNIGVGLGMWLIAEKGMKNSAAADGVAIGTLIAVMLRALNDYTPLGQYTAQLGMGDYQMQSFVTPQILVDPMNSAEIEIPAGWGQRALPAASAAPAPGSASMAASAKGGGGMSGLYDSGGSSLYGG